MSLGYQSEPKMVPNELPRNYCKVSNGHVIGHVLVGQNGGSTNVQVILWPFFFSTYLFFPTYTHFSSMFFFLYFFFSSQKSKLLTSILTNFMYFSHMKLYIYNLHLFTWMIKICQSPLINQYAFINFQSFDLNKLNKQTLI